MLTPSQAYRIASQWGSYIHSGDPGACFYGFHLDDGRPVSEEHRKACLAYLDEVLLPLSWSDIEFGRDAGVVDCQRGGLRDLRQLHQLRAFLLASPLTSS